MYKTFYCVSVQGCRQDFGLQNPPVEFTLLPNSVQISEIITDYRKKKSQNAYFNYSFNYLIILSVERSTHTYKFRNNVYYVVKLYFCISVYINVATNKCGDNK